MQKEETCTRMNVHEVKEEKKLKSDQKQEKSKRYIWKSEKLKEEVR